MTTVAEAAKMEEGGEDDLERIILLIPGKSKMIRVIHSCFVADGKIWGIHGTHVTSPIVDVPGRKACEKMLSMESYPSTEGFLNCKVVEEFSALAGEKRGSKMVLPSLFAVPPDLFVAVFNEPEMRADAAAVGVIKAFNDSVSDDVEVPEALLAFLWAVSQGGLGSIPLTYPVHKPAEASELAWKTIQRLMTGVKEGKPAGSENGPREMGVEGHRDPRQSPTPQGEEEGNEGAEDNMEVPRRRCPTSRGRTRTSSRTPGRKARGAWKALQTWS